MTVDDAGATPANSPTPASITEPNASRSPTSERSTATAANPASWKSPNGAAAAQQCATRDTSATVNNDRRSRASDEATGRKLPSPDSVGTRPASTAGSDGPSTCNTTVAPA